MALGYLISPALQLEDINGKPLTGGYLNVYVHGTTNRAVTYKDYSGNLNPNDIVLNGKGMAVVIADSGRTYDVYCYDRNSVEQWSRLNVCTIGSGSGGGGGEEYYAGNGILIDGANTISVDPNTVQGKLTAGDGINITDNVISATVSDNAFNATYGVTTLSEIEDAVEAGKAVFVTGIPDEPGKTLPLVVFRPNLNSAAFYAYSGTVVYSAELQPSGHWEYHVYGAQADWNEARSYFPAYIQNKPEIPPVLSAGSGIDIYNDVISRRVQLVTTNSSYAYVRNIIDSGDLPVLDVANGSLHNLYVCTMYRGSDIQFVGSAYGQTTLYNLASNNTWTSQILEPQILASNAGKILAVNSAGTDAEWRSWVAVPSYAFADRNKVLKVVANGSSVSLAWGEPSGYASWETDWASGYTHSYTVTADDVTAGYFDMYQSFAAGADTTSMITSPIRVNLTWDTRCTSGAASNYVSSIDFALGVDGGSYRDMFTDSAPAHEVHKDWALYPNYLLHTRCNRIRIRYHLTANATEGTQFSNEVSGLVDQVR